MPDEEIKTEEANNGESAKYLITFLAVGGIIAIRLTGKDLNWMEIALFAIGVLPWFSSFMDSFKFGKDGFEAVFKKELDKAKEEIKADVKEKTEKITEETASKINEVTETTTAKINEATEETAARIDEVRQSSEINQSLNTFGPGGKTDSAVSEYRTSVLEKSKNPDDPQKGRWGGNSNNDKTHRKLSVQVEDIPNNNYYKQLILRVESTEPVNFPLTEIVKFHLHTSFTKPVIEIKPTDNVAELKLVAWGAFTVAAEADNGDSKLELDIAEEYAHSEDPFYKR